MSRIGRLPVTVPGGVDIKIDGQTVSVKGPKGQLSRTFHENMKIAREDGKISVQRADDSQMNRALHGLTRTLIANMVTGVTTGFAKDLEISGTGYRAILQGKKLTLSLGFSHPIEIDPPAGVTFTVETPQKLKVSGIDKEAVGEVAAKIRGLREPDPYKAKGVKYAGEYIRRKAGKAGKVGAVRWSQPRTWTCGRPRLRRRRPSPSQRPPRTARAIRASARRRWDRCSARRRRPRASPRRSSIAAVTAITGESKRWATPPEARG